MSLPNLLKAYEVAEWLHKTPATVLQMAADGRLPHVKDGRSIAFREDQLLAWLEEHTHSKETSTSQLHAIGGKRDR